MTHKQQLHLVCYLQWYEKCKTLQFTYIKTVDRHYKMKECKHHAPKTQKWMF